LREDRESAVRPRTLLSVRPPAKLKGKNTAMAVWEDIITLQGETQAAEDGSPIITSFDKDLLIKYCLAEEECLWLEGIRTEVERTYRAANKRLERMKPRGGDLKDYFNALSMVNALLNRLKDFDARLDGKRKLLHTLAQSLYLTPRSRAGVAPAEREPPKPKSKLGKLID